LANTLQTGPRATAVAFSPDGQLLASTSERAGAQLWRVREAPEEGGERTPGERAFQREVGSLFGQLVSPHQHDPARLKCSISGAET
jgi:hypothetical protein